MSSFPPVRHRSALRRWADPVAGPALIVAAVLITLHGFWLSPRLTNQQVDQLAFWLPRWCYLGTNLAHGHLPTWLPNQFGGVPFLSDPQSGWLYLPAMALFSMTSCARALGLFVTLQPILAGLGLYLFFRNERVGRPAATVGGLTLALIMAGSAISLSVPFSGTLAWTALALAGAAGYLHAGALGPRLGWLAFTELCLIQVAAAHLTDGLVLAAVVLGLYLVARSVSLVRSGQRSPGSAALMVVGVFAVFPLLAAAILLPRLALLPRTAIGRGYVELGRLANQLSGTKGAAPLAQHGVGPWWGSAFARGPGGYGGALAILLLPVAFASRRWRAPAVALAAAGLLGWMLNLDALVSQPSARSFALKSSLGELWLRDPYRFRYLVPFAVAGIGGFAVQGWIDKGRTSGASAIARRSLWLVPWAALLVLAPLIGGAEPTLFVPLLIGSAGAWPLLGATATGRRWAAVALPLLTAAELVTVAVVTQGGPAPLPRGAPPSRVDPGLGRAFPTLHAPTIEPPAYTVPGPIGRTIKRLGSNGRYLTFDPEIAADPANPRGFLLHQQPDDWPAYENGRSILFGLDEVQGYSPVQLMPYWTLVRRIDREAPIYYNAAHLQRVDPSVLRLFAVRWVIQPVHRASAVAREGRFALYAVEHPEPMASLVFDWTTVSPGKGLRDTLNLRSANKAVVAPAHGAEPPPSSGQPAGGGRVNRYRELDPNHIRVEVSAAGPALLVVRNAYDRGWVATVDGREQPVLVADYLMQGVPVPAGTHVVDLRYRDEPLGVGLVVSGASWGLLLAWWLLAVVRSRRRATPIPFPTSIR
jgi:hypothetical protein